MKTIDRWGGDVTLANQLKRMTDAEIRAFWVEQQLAKRKAGLPFYDVLIDINGKIAVDLRVR
jgi:hypothetical protein